MKDYWPVTLGHLCNAGIEALPLRPAPYDGAPPIGRQLFRGLPFEVGGINPTPDNCFIHCLPGSDPVVVSIGRVCKTVVVAHALTDSRLPEGGEVGQEVASYTFRFAGDSTPITAEAVTIRERFEIAGAFRDYPFTSVDESGEKMLPRHEGRWEAAGRRQTEVTRGPGKYFLWVWRNSHPELVVEEMIITPAPDGLPFVIAGVTTGNEDEHPFTRQGRREVKVTLTDAEAAQRPFDTEVEVDRGIATYTHPLPEADVEEFINDDRPGWGETQNQASSPVYTEIAATPSATVDITQGGTSVGKVRWSDVQERGSAEDGGARVELLDGGRNWVHVTVLDDDTNRPLPCRVHFRSPAGVPYQPHGHHNQVNSNNGSFNIDVGGDVRMGQITYAYIDGRCQGWLPRGEVIVDAACGFEYEPLRSRMRIEPGQREVTLRLKRWTDMNRQGWYSGDSHVHFLSAQGSHTESQGEGLNVVNLLQSQWGSLFTNTEEFIGRASVHQQGNNIVYVSQENRQHSLGHLILWGLKKPVMPWCSDGPGEAEPGGSLDVTMSDWADQTHAQGGHVIIPHLPHPNGEPATLIATGRADGVEMLRQNKFNHLEYYRYLNCGYRLPLVGGTDKMSSDVPIGLYRTYARVGNQQEFNYQAWCETVKQGRTFLSGGPLIGITVNGAEIGDTLQISASGTVEVHAWAESILPIQTLQIVQEGRVVAQTDMPSTNGSSRYRLELQEKVHVNGHSWLAARVGGPGYSQNDGVQGDGFAHTHHDGWQRGIFAHTSPVYVAVGGDWWMFDRDAAEYMLTLIDGCLSYVRNTAPIRRDEDTTFHHGEDDHSAYLERPFHEAREAIHRRMHQLGVPH